MRLAPRALMSAVTALLMAATVPISSAQVPVDPDFFPGACRDVDEMDAMAKGRGIPIYVAINDEQVLPDFLDPGVAEAEQVGPGKAGDRVGAIDVAIPNEDNPIVMAQVLASRVDLDVDGPESGLEAEAWTITRLAHVNVLDGLVTADLVRAFAYARADVRSATTWTDPSTIVNLQVRGVSITDISPGTNITLPDVLFGPGSYVSVYERIDKSQRPDPENPFWVADVQVRMINVHISNLPLLGEVDVIISDSYAHAESPNPWCGQAQSVEAGAYILRVREALDTETGEHGLLFGEQHIGVTGGSGHAQLFGEHLTVGSLEVLLNVTETDVNGEIVMDDFSESNSMAQVLRLCIKLDADEPECLVSAILVRAEVHCYADEDGSFCEGGTKILELVIDGVNVCAALGQDEGGLCEPEPNTELAIGPITVILNEHERVDEEDGFSSLYVRAVRIETPIPAVGTIIISRAYASAGYEDVSPNEETDEWLL